MALEKFDGAANHLVVTGSPWPVTVYAGDANQVMIRQASGREGWADDFVVVAPEDAEALIEAIRGVAEQIRRGAGDAAVQRGARS